MASFTQTEIEYSDEKLQQLFDAMTYEQRIKALKGAFRRAANKVRKVAVNNLRTSGLRTSRNMEKGIHVAVWRKRVGFNVSIFGSMYTNRRGIKKPVLTFAEGGTIARYTRWKFTRKQRFTGKMRSYGFMAKTERETQGKVTDELHAEVVNSITKAAQKYGCK